mgnify:CR=1 FL=1|jgi:transposase-like protein|tara:strand:- start:77 stop:1444 length:1368 start_codon:yes stop_codon:yes gene_type:complete
MIKTKKMLEVESRIGEPIEVYLKREYEVNRKSTVQIGKKLGISDVGISKWIRNLEIKTRGKLEAKLPKGFVEPTKEELNKWYHIEGKSTVKIGRELGVGYETIIRLLRKNNLKVRNNSEVRLPKGFVKPTKEQLEKLYNNKWKSTSQIGRELGVFGGVVCKWMNEYKIKLRSNSEAHLPKGFVKPTKEELNRLYNKEGKSAVEIGEELGISNVTIIQLIKEYGVKLRSISEANLPKGFTKPTKEELNKWYHIEGKSTVKIGRELGVSDGTIRNWIKEYGIPKRNTNTISEKFLNLLKKDKTALNLSVAALSLNGQGYDLEKTIVEVYEGTFKDEKQLHALLLENENEIYRLAQNGVTNLGKYLGQFTFGDRRIMPLLLGEALESIPEDKVTEPLEERFARILRTNYSPRFNENSKKTMNDLEKKIASSSEKVKGIYQKLYNHYEEVLELERELNN